jgi:hypothetical protein
VSAKATGFLPNESGEYLPPASRSSPERLPHGAQQGIGEQTVLVAGCCCESNHLRQMMAEIVNPFE